MNQKKNLVIILIPSAKSKLFKFKIPYKYLKFIFFIGVLFVFFNAFLLFKFISLSMQVGKVEDLIKENSDLNRMNSQLQLDVDNLVQRIENLDSTKRKLFKMLDITPNESGLGSIPETGDLSNNYPQGLIEKSRYLTEQNEKHFNQIEPEVKKQVAYLASIPSIWPVRGYITSYMKYRIDPITKTWQFHKGVDIVNRLGTPILAPADGIVVVAEQVSSSMRRKGFGNYVVLEHRFGYKTKYGHLENINVKKFQKIKRGDVIGFMGNTGRSTSVHLHFEVIYNSINVNPIDYMLND